MNINLHPIVKNLLIINIIMFAAVYALERFDIDFRNMTAMHYIGSLEFAKRPYQLISHMFMHANIPHIFMNMFALVMFGNILENILGSKRFIILYFVAGLGSVFLDFAMQAWQLYQASGHIFTSFARQYEILEMLNTGEGINIIDNGYSYSSEMIKAEHGVNFLRTAVGASGALYGVIVAFALFFPNTELYLMFIPIPIKAKYLVPGVLGLDLFFGASNFSWDPVAHWAHLGGAIAGFVLIKFWQKDRNSLY